MTRFHSLARNAFLILTTLAVPVLASPAKAPDGERPASSTLAITDVNVLPLDREVVLPHQTVLISGNSILKIGPSTEVEVPNEARVIPGTGRFLVPGLADMHAHPKRSEGRGPGDYLREGITVLRVMAGHPSHLEFRELVRSGKAPGPIVFVAGQPLTSSDHFRSHRRVTSAEEGRIAVREQVAEGYDFIKVYSLLSLEAFDGIMEEANRLGIPVVGHVSDQVPIEHAMNAGLASVEHLFGYFWPLESASSTLQGKWAPRRLFHAVEIDPERLPAIAAATAAAGVWNCPTLWRKANYLTSPLAKEAWETPSLRALGESNRRQLVKALHDAGAGLLAGTDDQPAILREELGLLVEAGLSPYDALRTATVNAGEFLGLTGYGTIAVGKDANLLLLEANPLADIANTKGVVGVVVNGVWIPRGKPRDPGGRQGSRARRRNR